MIEPPRTPLSGEFIRATFMRDLIDWIRESVMPHGDGKTTRCMGNIVTAIQSDADASYKGMFRVSLVKSDSTTTLKVDWPEDEERAGWGWFNAYKLNVPNGSGITPQEGWLCLKVTPSAATNPTFTYAYVFSTGFPARTQSSSATAAGYWPIAYVSGSASDGWSVRQVARYAYADIWTFGSCDEGDDE